MGGLGRHSISLIRGVVVSEFRVEEPVPDAFLLSSIYRLILVKTGKGDSVVNSGL